MSQIQKYKIAWFTADYFLQVDLPILNHLKDDFDIKWYVIGTQNSASVKLAKEYAEQYGIDIQNLCFNHLFIDPRHFFEWKTAMASIKSDDIDIYYFDISTFPFLLPVIKTQLPAHKVILAMHHGKIHSGMRLKPLYRPFLKHLNRQPFTLQYFSKSQADAFVDTGKNRKYIIPLPINKFGEVYHNEDKETVRFTAFGNIINSKNIPLLIEAANILYESFPDKFKIKIAGHCKNWENDYQPLIKHPEAFDCTIRRIEEHEITDLFANTDYLMLPYKSVTQSGPLRIAYGHNVPVITSDLEGFKESVVPDVTGLLFKSESVDELVKVMTRCIENHPNLHDRLMQSQALFVDENLNKEKILSLYRDMFNKVGSLNR